MEVDKAELTGRKPVFKKDDVVYGYLRPYLNKVWVAEFDGLCSVDQYVYSVDSAADPRYLAWFMRSEIFLSRAPISQTPGQLPRIRLNEVASVAIDLPPLREQREIAAALEEQMNTVGRARAAAEARLEAATALRAARTEQIFGSEAARNWERRAFSGILERPGQYGLSQAMHRKELGLPVLRMGNISEGQIDWTDLRYLDLTEPETDKYRLVEGDLLFNRTNSAELVGKSAIFLGGRDALFASYLIRFRLRPEIADSRFVCAYINSDAGRSFVRENMARAVGQVDISASVMARMPIPVPPIECQRSVVADLEGVRSIASTATDAAEREKKAVEALPAALLRRAFRGEL